MTTDHIQNKHIVMRSRISKFRELDGAEDAGLELTRLENFLDGRQDIFDVLERHAANKKKFQSSMQINKPSDIYAPAKDKHENLDDFWSRLKKQIKRLKDEENI